MEAGVSDGDDDGESQDRDPPDDDSLQFERVSTNHRMTKHDNFIEISQ